MLSDFNKNALNQLVHEIKQLVSHSGGDFTAEEIIESERRKRNLTAEEVQYLRERTSH